RREMRRRSHQPERLRVVGGLPPMTVRAFGAAALSASLLLLGTACNEEKRAPMVTRERSQAIQTPQGNTPAAEPSPAPVAAVASSAPAPRPRKALCDGQLREDGKPLPKRRVTRAVARGTDPKPEPIPSGRGQWTWVNFWAAWCAPCKEEIPRLKGWEERLSSGKPGLRVVFVSLDDDERQLRGFLESGALDSTYWLREGREREEWMSDAGLGIDPELPIHL